MDESGVLCMWDSEQNSRVARARRLHLLAALISATSMSAAVSSSQKVPLISSNTFEGEWRNEDVPSRIRTEEDRGHVRRQQNTRRRQDRLLVVGTVEITQESKRE